MPFLGEKLRKPLIIRGQKKCLHTSRKMCIFPFDYHHHKTMTDQQTQIILDTLLQYKNRDFANRTLARKICSDNPGVFSPDDIERVRRRIGYRRGANGNTDRKRAIPELIRPEQKPSEYMANFLAKAHPPKTRDWHLPKTVRRTLILSDIHFPYHDVAAINIALDYGYNNGMDAIYLNGDIIDFAPISRFAKDPTGPNIQVEIDGLREFLYGLKGLNIPIFFKMGNHEERWNSYLIRQAPELYDVDSLQIESILGLEELGIELIESRAKAHFGKLLVIHGHEFGESTFSPVNPARGLFLRAKTSVVAGHNHQTSSHQENDLNGNPTVCNSIGCLCDLSPDYRPFAFTKWNHGFAFVEIEEDGHFSLHNKRIIEGRVR